MFAEISPWTLITLIFAVQVCGALLVLAIFGVSFDEVRFPILVLVAGSVTALAFRLCDRDDRVNSFKWWVPSVFYALFIYLMSSSAYPDATPPFTTKIFHPIEYMTLAFLLCLAFDCVFAGKGTRAMALFVLAFGGIWAAGDEFHQSFVPGRHPVFTDVLIDLCGIAAGYGVYLAFRRLSGIRLRPRLAE